MRGLVHAVASQFQEVYVTCINQSGVLLCNMGQVSLEVSVSPRVVAR